MEHLARLDVGPFHGKSVYFIFKYLSCLIECDSNLESSSPAFSYVAVTAEIQLKRKESLLLLRRTVESRESREDRHVPSKQLIRTHIQKFEIIL
jgi:hypothetical protein